MTQGKWLSRALHVTIALSFILGAFVVAPSSVSADHEVSQWVKQSTPTENDLVIVPGSDIIDFDVTGPDGMTIYAIGTLYDDCENEWSDGVYGPNDLFSDNHFPKLWRSTDGGVTWDDQTSKVIGASNLPDLNADGEDWNDFTFFAAVSAAPDDEDFVVVAGWGYDATGVDVTDAAPFIGGAQAATYNYIPVVVGSDDGADKFYYMGCPTVTGMITAVDVSMEIDGEHSIAVGTWDWEQAVDQGNQPRYEWDNAMVWRFDAGGYWTSYWTDATAYDGWEPCDAVIDLEFSPNFDVDDTIVVLCIDDVNGSDVDVSWGNDDTTDGNNDFLGFKVQGGAWDSIDGWNSEAEFDDFPVVIRNDDDMEIVSPIDPDLGSGWDDVGALVRHAGDLDLPQDYMGDDDRDRVMMVGVNGAEFDISDVAGAANIRDDGGFLFWVEDDDTSLEILYPEDNPYISTIDYSGNVDMEGRTLIGLAFPEDWGWLDIQGWWATSGEDPAIPPCEGVQVLRSETTDVCCPDWEWACKPPSGQFLVTVMMTPGADWGYAGTMGESYMAGAWSGDWWSDESAFSITGHEGEVGDAWNQSGLIDTDIDFIADVAVTTDPDGDDLCQPSCGCLYIATINTTALRQEEGKLADCDSIWRSADGGSSWLRIWHKQLQGEVMTPHGADWPNGPIEWMVLGLVPGEHPAENVYMADLGTETVWYSSASGDADCPGGLGCWTDRNTGLGMWPDEGDLGIADIAVLDESTIYVVAFNGDMVKSTTSGRHWSSQEDTKVDDDSGELAHHMVALGDWVLVGGNMGTVSYSDDGGDSFSVLDDIGAGEVHVAFDSYFDDNGYVYGAVAQGDNGVYRTTIDDAEWEDMKACPELDYWGVVVSDGAGNPETGASTGGVLYASYNGSDVVDCVNSGVARILNPAAQDCCGDLSWDYLWTDLWPDAEFTVQANNIAICGDASGGASTIWAIDTGYLGIEEGGYYDGWDECDTAFIDSDVGRLWKYVDVYSKSGPELIGIPDGSVVPTGVCEGDCTNEDFVLEWDRLCDACEYDIQISLNEAFTHIVWNTSTIAGAWTGAGFVTHEDCADGVLESCESDMTFYKPADPCAPSIVVPKGTLEANTTYWWRVRARAAETGEVYRSWWSDKWSFTVAVGSGGAIKLTAPDDGATNVPTDGIVFTWTNVQGADSYAMTLWDSAGAEVASSAGDSTSFIMTEALDYDSPYTWQVDAVSDGKVISSSNTSTFRTMMQPTPPPEIPETVINFPEPPGTPTWVWVVIALAAVLIIVVIVLIFRTRRV
jgi:hypothetical protein